MKKTTLISFIIVSSCLGIYAQTGIFVKGQVLDARTGTPLPYVALFFEGSATGDVANSGGRFSIEASHELVAQSQLKVMYTGYETKLITLPANNLHKLTIYLSPAKDREEIEPMKVMRDIAEQSSSKIPYYVYKLTNWVIENNMPLGNKHTNKIDLYNLREVPAYNTVEGVRLRLSAATNARLHRQLFAKASIGYGFRDQKVKHREELAWSFDKKAYHEEEFPRNNIRFIHEYDIFSPGENNIRLRNDLLLISYRRSRYAMLYRQFAELNYEKETLYGLSYTLWGRASDMTSASNRFFYISQEGVEVHQEHLKVNDVGISFKYWPHQAYLQDKRQRTIVSETHPLFYLSHTVGQAKLPTRTQLYHKTELSYQQRFNLSHYGNLDIVADYQKMWNRAPFPLLLYPNTSIPFLVDNKAFFLLRAFDFIHDEQYSLKATFIGDKLLLARIPILNRLSMRELFIVRGVKGTLSQKNRATQENGLFVLPQSTISMSGKPYMEAVVGITNILGVVRVEYVHRLTYRNLPNALKHSFRFDVTI